MTGESAPVIREAGGDRSGVTGGTRVLSDRIVIRVTANPGETFLDRMIALVEGAERQRTPNEIALSILLAGMSLIFLVVCAALVPMAHFAGAGITLAVLAALFVSLIPTTIGALLSAIGIAGMNRLVRRNVLATSGRAVEAAGDVSVLLLDKTGTITLGNRQAARFLPVPGVTDRELAEAAQLSSLPDETPEGRSIVVLAKELFDLRGRDLSAASARFIAVLGRDPHERRRHRRAASCARARATRCAASSRSAAARSRAELRRDRRRRRARRLDAARGRPRTHACSVSSSSRTSSRTASARASTRCAQAGIRTVMITGDNPLTAAAIAAEAGVDDYLAEATPEAKLALIRKEQEGGQLIAMTGDGTNDAPALAQADVGVAMNAGTSAAKEAGNMVDLDSNPTKLLDIVEIGKQLLITRGALTTFSISNDLAKYFAIIPAIFVAAYPQLDSLNILDLHSPHSAILSAIIFNALIIVALVPLALRGVRLPALVRGEPAAPQRRHLRPRRDHRAVHRHQAHRHHHHRPRSVTAMPTIAPRHRSLAARPRRAHAHLRRRLPARGLGHRAGRILGQGRRLARALRRPRRRLLADRPGVEGRAVVPRPRRRPADYDASGIRRLEPRSEQRRISQPP